MDDKSFEWGKVASDTKNLDDENNNDGKRNGWHSLIRKGKWYNFFLY